MIIRNISIATAIMEEFGVSRKRRVSWNGRFAMDVQPINLQQLHDAIMTEISKECFQLLAESIPRRIKAVLKAKGGPTCY